jgi:hypothetical protein
LDQRLTAFAEGFRQNLALIGPPGSGKTFQLERLLANPPSHLTLIYCPLSRETRASLLYRLRCAVLQAGVGGAPSHALDVLMERAQAQVPNTAAAIRTAGELAARRCFGEALTRTLDAIPILIEEQHRPCVLILDEFLFLEELGMPHAFHELGKRVMTWTSTLFILSSSAPSRARAILRERLQLLFGQFELLALDALDGPIVAAWVQQELRRLRGVNEMSPFLIRWLGSYPRYLALFLKRLKELAALHDTTELSEALFFQAAWDLVGSPEGALHQGCLARTERLAQQRRGDQALEALIHVAEGSRTTTDIGRRIGRSGLADALQVLIEEDLVLRKGTCWLIPDPVVRCWLTTVFAPRRRGVVLDVSSLRARFEQYLSSAWQQWLHTSQLSFADQVVRLLKSFRDDTVALDSKTGRLPRFQTIRSQRDDRGRANTYLVAEGEGKRWCCVVHDGVLDEAAVAQFNAFCRCQTPRPSRKVVITRSGMDENARLVAKANSMWVWEPDDFQMLLELYG